MSTFQRTWLVCLLTVLLAAGSTAASAAPLATRFAEDRDAAAISPPAPSFSPLDVLGSPVSFATAIQLGGDYGQRMQADVTEDNAGNGSGGSESPNDPDDAGWDWVLDADVHPYFHSTAASPTNLYGVCSLGLYYAYLRNTSDTGIRQAMTDAANRAVAAGTGDIRTSSDMVFLMLYDDLPWVTGTTYADAAKAKLDARVAAHGGSGATFAAWLRDDRGINQGYKNGIIGWDLGAYGVACQMLYDRYGLSYDTWADQIAEVLWQDSFNDSPGFFDVVDDAGYLPDYSDTDFWWYNLGISGLIDAFAASGSHTAEIPWLVQRIRDSQHSTGAVGFSYGINPNDEDWQSTAYAAMTLARLDQPTYQLHISHMAYFLGATQDPTYGAWLYSDNTHYPEVGMENTSGMYFGVAPTTVVVDDGFTTQAAVDAYNTAHSTSYVLGFDAFASIQLGVNAVAGSTVIVEPGTYEEQVVITTNNLVLDGAGVGSTIIRSPVSLAASFSTPTVNKPVVFVNGATGVTIKDLTVDGFGRGNANYRFIGVAFWNGGGALLDCDVIGVRETPLSGSQHGVGVYSFNNTGGPYSLEVGRCSFSDYQKNAMALSGTGMTVNVHDCTATGAGDLGVPLPAQNGIQVGFGAGGAISNCTVAAMRYTPTSDEASGFLIYLPGSPVTISGTNPVGSTVEGPVNWYDGNGTIGGMNVTGGDNSAIYITNTTTLKSGQPPSGTASPLSDPYDPTGDTTTYTVAVSGGCLTGLGTGSGITVQSASQPLDVTVSNMRISSYARGLEAIGPAAGLDATNCGISGNATAGYDNSGCGAAQSAEWCWWGHASGPSGTYGGSGDAILGANVDANPWHTSGSSSTPCAFTPQNQNLVTPGPAPSCVSTVNPCVVIPVGIGRTDNASMRGFSVAVTLAGSLTLCGAGITEGTYLSAVAGSFGTDFHVTGTHPSYTVDCAILGGSVGATAPTGNLFNIRVASTAATGTGTVTVTSVTLRDLVNAPIPGTAGAPLSITIDNTPPVAVSNLVATQVLTGNDGDGTTKITLTFTAPGDGLTREVYRAPFGNYPEYDDAPGAGSVPTTPAYPPPSPWTLTTVTATGQTDEVAWPSRDFWYYVIFTKDACGNVSGVSNKTNGTLNYHLGDVADATPPMPAPVDNLVGFIDISDLGAHYGIAIGPGSPFNYLDVGPTTNYSTLARPTTDNLINFEDLMMFAINYGTVTLTSPPELADVPAGRPGLVLETQPTTDGVLARLVLLDNPGNVKGIHALIDYDHSRLTLLGVDQGSLLDAQGQPIFFRHLDEGAAGVHAAVLGQEVAIHGTGVVATLRFRGHGEPSITLADLRDLQNQPAGEATTQVETPLDTVEQPLEFALLAARPNPFNPSTMIGFQLPIAGRVDLRIYDIGGRLVRTLVEGELSPGAHTAYWDGRDARGMQASSGVYLVRLDAMGQRATQKIQLMK